MDKIKDLEQYLAETGRTIILTDDEEKELLETVQKKGAGSDAAKEKLMKTYQRFVVSLASQYQNKGLTLVELIEIGNVGLGKAITDFHYDGEEEFLRFAVAYIRREIALKLVQ